MIDRSTEEQRKVFEDVWARGQYRLGSPGQRIVPRFLDIVRRGVNGCPMINDYGSGTGRASLELWKAGYLVNMVDIAENALEDEAKALIGKGLTFTLASLWELPADFPVAPWGYCMEVLMTIPEPKMARTLSEIARTCRNLFVQVYHRHVPRAGHECNLIQWDKDRWRDELLQHYAGVVRIESLEIPLRYLYVCRGAIKC